MARPRARPAADGADLFRRGPVAPPPQPPRAQPAAPPRKPLTLPTARFQALFGVVCILAIAWLLSSDRRRVNWRTILAGVSLQFALAAALLYIPIVVQAFDAVARGVNAVISAADEGIAFVWGNLGNPSGDYTWGFVFFIRVSSIIIFFASLTAVLYHVGIMPRVVAALAWVLRRTMGITGAEALSAAANIFVGQTEAPLTVRPYIPRMTQSQIMALMTGGFATIAGSVFGAFVAMLGGSDPEQSVEFAKHLITASVLAAPGSLVLAKLMMPETERPADESARIENPIPSANVVDAAALGATEGMKLALNVAAMLIAFVSLLALANIALGALANTLRATGLIDPGDLTIQRLLAYPFAPFAWLLGIPWSDCGLVGSLLGQKIILTEFVAYKDLAAAIHAPTPLIGERSAKIAAYALCGFANIPSIAIQIGGLSTLAPDRRVDFVRIGPRAMLAGTLSSCLVAAIAGVMLA